jgi:mxaJ protein
MLPMAFDISMGVRKDERALLRELDEVLAQQEARIQALLREYGIPVLAGAHALQHGPKWDHRVPTLPE